MNIIRLTKGQKKQMKVNHPLLDGCAPMTDDQLVYAWGAGDRDSIIMGHFYIIKIIVGRFLANWTETRRFEEDMVAEGMLSLVETVDTQMGTFRLDTNFQGTVWNKIQVAIEFMLNRDRSMFAPSKVTQWGEVSEGREPIYNYAKQLNESVEGGLSDYSTEFVDILDELQLLVAEDREALCLIIYRCMEQDHNILEGELSQDELDSIDNITKAITEL